MSGERKETMQTRGLILSAVALIVLCGPSALAQSQPGTNSTNSGNNPSATAPAAPAKPGEIQQRKENQQDRIAQGVQSGQLTAGETKNLETKEAGLNKEEHNMRTQDNGHLTGADRAKLNNQQNRLSNQIYQDKHNAAQAHYGNGTIGQRRQNQQDRIAQGIRSGQLRPGETAKLENQQQGINRTVSGMRQANGGKLTQADKAAVNQQQNKASQNIYNKKHNAARAPR